MGIGAFTFVLHSHLPYCRRAGRWPHGEEWLHEAALGTYLPLLMALYDLKKEGSSFKLTLSFTPVLVEQLADPLVKLNEALTAYRTAATRPLEQPLATTTATTGPADQTEADAKKKIDQAIALSDKASKQATSGEFKALTLANLAAVYYRASLLLPAESERWLNSAKETCLELMKQRVDPKSPIAGLVLQLQSVLEIQPPKPGSAETGA